VLTFGNIGIGVPDNEKEFIFERHYRATNAQRKVREGTGIGLSIVKAFADHYGGIEVESYQLEGSSRHHTLFRLKIRRE
jgi:signal transduction histidine kinase